MKRAAVFFGLLLAGTAPLAVAGEEAPWQSAVAAKDFPAAERLLRQELASRTQDQEARFALARVLAWQGRYAEALREYDTLLAAQPANADYLLGRAQTLYWSGDLPQAVEAAAKAKAVAPDYLDAWRLEIQALLATTDGESTQRAAATLAAAEQRFGPTAVADLRQRLTAREHPETFVPQREVEAGGSYEHLTHGYDSWKSLYLEGENRYQAGRTVYGQGRFTDRYRLDDTELMLGTVQRLTDNVDWQVEASGSPTHEVLPEYTLLLGGSARFAPGWDAGLTARHSAYTHTYSNLYSFGLGHEMGPYRLEYMLYAGQAEDASAVFAHRLQGTWYYGGRNRVGLYVAVGQETENSGEPGADHLLTDSVRSIGIIGRHWFGDGPWGIGYHLWNHKQSDRYTRTGGSLGLRYRF